MGNPVPRELRTFAMTEVMAISRRLRSVPFTDTALNSDPLADDLLRCGRGDQMAFAALYDQLAPYVYGVVLRVVRDPSQAEEVTQEVFVELWRIAPRFDGKKGSVKAWSATVAHRRAVDRVRSEQSARNRTDKESHKRITETDVVVETVEASFDQARVRRALANLTPGQREAVELAYFGAHTYREVAVLLGVAEGTIKSRIRDGMIRLRDELGAETP
ncbi:ECF RNA polymerase sigma factor SigK [soil metagenome]